jgi:hypothetical protein
VEHDPQPLKVNVAHTEQADLARAQAVAVGDQENGSVPLVSNPREQPARLVER